MPSKAKQPTPPKKPDVAKRASAKEASSTAANTTSRGHEPITGLTRRSSAWSRRAPSLRQVLINEIWYKSTSTKKASLPEGASAKEANTGKGASGKRVNPAL